MIGTKIGLEKNVHNIYINKLLIFPAKEIE